MRGGLEGGASLLEGGVRPRGSEPRGEGEIEPGEGIQKNAAIRTHSTRAPFQLRYFGSS